MPFKIETIYCKKSSEAKAKEHAQFMKDKGGDKIIEFGSQYTDKHGWRSWCKFESWQEREVIEDDR